MTAGQFCRYELRTTDVNSARAFYTDILGSEFWGSDVSAIELPEQAAARGAPAHWLGHIGVSDVAGTVGQFMALGAQRLGPAQQSTDGAAHAIVRDPFGVIVALRSETATARRLGRAPVAWHLMHTEDPERAFAVYSDLFGWTAKEALELGPELGRHQLFAWDESGTSAGSVANTAQQPHIHPQWMFFFPVANLEVSLARVRALGGIAPPALRTSNGDLAAPCDDPQGGAFALYQFAD
jgi:predicted enzyme related to lactoylglutathione lyase